MGEYNFQNRLQTKFDWVSTQLHSEERCSGILKLSSEQLRSIELTQSYLLPESQSLGLTCGRFDIMCLAAALELSLELVTDDLDLLKLAKIYQAPVKSTLELLAELVDSKGLSFEEVKNTIIGWSYFDDLPSDFHNEFVRLFGVEPQYHP